MKIVKALCAVLLLLVPTTACGEHIRRNLDETLPFQKGLAAEFGVPVMSASLLHNCIEVTVRWRGNLIKSRGLQSTAPGKYHEAYTQDQH
jgi:hypothetical protein